MTADPLQILKTVYGYDTFRGRQADIIRHVMAGNNAFVLMPTGLVSGPIFASGTGGQL
ncbi:hypothetical protein [Agrobacterium tumefaciens]|uniref:hypothetical protein n=1 Tax=Agrobacterium tumefaciens TaxID=358 RepID=UPI0015866931|nr:hypothetical protein [Agrobacterium tumefaciens]